MIKINLVGEKKQPKGAKQGQPRVDTGGGGGGGGQNLLLVGILVVAVVIAGGWWWSLSNEIGRLETEHQAADRELERLAEIRKKGEEYERRKALLQRKIDLITNLKAQQDVPVHIMDQVSRALPPFVWLESMNANKNQITISGKATTYNAVSNFYGNLDGSGHFQDVTLGRTFEVPEGVAFSLTCRFAPGGAKPAAAEAGGQGNG